MCTCGKKHDNLECVITKATSDAEFAEEDTYYTRNVENSEQYKTYEQLVQDSLRQQWLDLVYSGVIFMTFKEYASLFSEAKKNGKTLSKKQLNKIKTQTAIRATRRMQGIEKYNKLKYETRQYIRHIMNVGGQRELNLIPGVDKEFDLTNKEYTQVITQRAETLLDGMDVTTAKRFTNALVSGVSSGKSQEEVAGYLVSIIGTLAVNRAERIVSTESTAGYEYMRGETGRRNGVIWKIRQATLDEKTCPICGPLHGQRVRIGKSFKGSPVDLPPVHPMCRCRVEYLYEDSMCSNFVKSKGEIVGFQKKAGDLYPESEEDGAVCVNPNAVRTGGQGIEGEDKDIGTIYEGIGDDAERQRAIEWYRENREEADELAKILYDSEVTAELGTKFLGSNIKGSILSKVDRQYTGRFLSLGDEQISLIWSRTALSNPGFKQLVGKMGYNGNISEVNFYRAAGKKLMPTQQTVELLGDITSTSDVLATEKVMDFNSMFRPGGKNDFLGNTGLSDKEFASLKKKNNASIMKREYKMTEDEIYSLHVYTSTNVYKPLNKTLRGFSDEYKEQYNMLAEKMESGMQKFGSEAGAYKGTSYRGIKLDEAQKKQFLEKIKVGETFQDSGFLSTSKYEDETGLFGGEGILFRINGKSGIEMYNFSKYSEGEVLFGRNVKFKVDNLVTEGGQVIIDMTEL